MEIKEAIDTVYFLIGQHRDDVNRLIKNKEFQEAITVLYEEKERIVKEGNKEDYFFGYEEGFEL